MAMFRVGIIVYILIFCTVPRTVHAQVEASDRIKIKKLVNQAEQAVERIEDVCQQIELLSEIAIAQAELGDRAAAHTTFQRTVKLILQEDLNEGVRQKKFPRINNLHWRIQMLTSVVKRQGETLGWKSSEKSFQQIIKMIDTITDTPKDHYLETIAVAQAEAGDFDGALRWARHFDESGDPRQSGVLIFNAVARAKARIGDIAGAVRVAEELSARPAWTLDEIALAQIKAGDIKGALQTYNKAVEFNNKEFTHLEVLLQIGLAQASIGDQAAAAMAFKKAAEHVKSNYVGNSKIGLALREVGKAQLKSGDRAAALVTLHEASSYIKKMVDPGAKAIFLTGILQLLAQAGDWKTGLADVHILEEAPKVGAPADLIDKIGVLLTLGKAQAAAGEQAGATAAFRRAFGLARKMRWGHHPDMDFSYRASAFRGVARAQVIAGDIKGAMQVAEAGDGEVKELTLIAIAVTRAELGDFRGAAETISLVKNQSKDEFFMAMTLAHATRGDLEGALGWSLAQASPLAKARGLLNAVEKRIGRPLGFQLDRSMDEHLLSDENIFRKDLACDLFMPNRNERIKRFLSSD